MGVLEGAKWVSWVHSFQTKHFLDDSGQISGLIGHISNYKYRLENALFGICGPRRPILHPRVLITHFATIQESFEDLENFKILLHFTILGISVDVDIA